MWLRETLKRWIGRPDAGRGDDIARAPATLLEELVADGEDFADLAAVLRLDPRMVVATLVAERPIDAAALLTALAVRAASSTTPASDATITSAAGARGAADVVASRSAWASFGRWTRVRGGTRVHRESSAKVPRPALAAP